jgi:hypothetical protein
MLVFAARVISFVAASGAAVKIDEKISIGKTFFSCRFFPKFINQV